MLTLIPKILKKFIVFSVRKYTSVNFFRIFGAYMGFLTLKTCFSAQRKSATKSKNCYHFTNISAKSNEQIVLFDQKTTTFSCFCAKITTYGEAYFFLDTLVPTVGLLPLGQPLLVSCRPFDTSGSSMLD